MMIFLFIAFVICQIKYVSCNLALDIDLQSNGCPLRRGDPAPPRRWCSPAQLISWIKVNNNNAMTVRHGWNLAVINHKTGQIEKTGTFQTFLDRGASVLLERFIEGIENKRIVLGVVHIDGSRHLKSNGFRALQSVGGKGFNLRTSQWSYAFIGYKDSFALPKDFCVRVGQPPSGVPGYLKATIGKIKYGDDMHFTLKSIGFLDRGSIDLNVVKSFVRYGETATTHAFGITIMVVDHTTGDIRGMKSYGTFHHTSESDAMVNYIRTLPRGLIVLGVVHSSWTGKNTPTLNQVLQQLFFTHVPTTTRGGSWAMVGYTGGRIALPYNDLPMSRMTLSTTKPRHPVLINYFTNILDADECKNGKATCISNTVCRNTIGSYECDCKNGFKKSGTRCVDIDECATGNNICGARASCENTPGSYICRCKITTPRQSFGLKCTELSIKISGPDCYHQRLGKPPICKKLPIKIEINGKNVLGKPKRGYKIVTLDSYSGTVDTVAVFDTWLHSDERTKVSNNLKAVSQHKIVIGAVYKDEHNSMPAAVNTTVKQLTGHDIPAKYSGAYAFIGFKGPFVPHWTTLKSTKVYGGPFILEQRIWTLPKPPYTAIKIASLGYKRGKSAETYIQIGTTKVYERQLKQGFNFVIVDEWSGRLETLRSFNTHDKTLPDIKRMESFLNNLPTGRIVVGVVKGEAFQGIRDNINVQTAIGRLLGSSMKLKSLGESYAFIGSTYTGRKPPFVQQVTVQPGGGPAELSQPIQFGTRPRHVRIVIISTGCDDPGPHRSSSKCYLAPNSIKVDGEEQSVKGRGVNIVVVNQINGRVLNRKRFDTTVSAAEAYKMAEFIEALPRTAIVLGAVKDNARGYFFNETKLVTAMTQLLGKEPTKFAAARSYAFIGFKGKTKPSWVKQEHRPIPNGGVRLEAVIPLVPELRIFLASTACKKSGHNTCSGSRNSILINDTEYTKNGDGFNLAVVNLQNGNVENASNFDPSRGQSSRMVTFLNGLPEYRAVVGVVKNDGYQGLSEEAKRTIAKLIKKTGIKMSAQWQSYLFVGFTSDAGHFLTKEEVGSIPQGSKSLSTTIPLMPRGCLFPKSPENARIRRVEYDASEDAAYRCLNGMVLVGRPQYCSHNGTWLGEMPKCEVGPFSKISSSSRLRQTVLVSLFMLARVINTAISLILF